MCGIAGIFGKSFDVSTINQTSLLESISHRGRDSKNVHVDKYGVFGHTRLKIVGDDNFGHQPAVSKNGRYVIVFNGEIYNYKELNNQFLKEKTYSNTSDTYVLLGLINEFGINKTLSLIDGPFAVAVLDRKYNILHLARDKFGEKPLYYFQRSETLWFSSDISTFKLDKSQFNINPYAIHDIVCRKAVYGCKTIYDEIYKVPAGALITYNLKKSNINTEKFFDKYLIENTGSRCSSSFDILKNSIILEKALTQRIIQLSEIDVPYGTLLSGGIDSALVSSILSKTRNNKFVSFTFKNPSQLHDESEHASMIAAILGIKNYNISITKSELLHLVDNLNDVYTEPLADSSQLAMMAICKFASNFVKVIFTGDCGDELFGGYNRYVYAKYLSTIFDVPTLRTALAAAAYFGKMFNTKDRKLAKILDLVRCQNFAELYNKSIISNNYTRNIYSDEFKSHVINKSILSNDINSIEEFLIEDLYHYTASDVLVKVDRSTMFYGMEARLPFLGKEIYRHSQEIPMSQKIKGTKTKVILRNILERYVPTELISKKKLGFSSPVSDWLRFELRELSEFLFSKESLEQTKIFDPKYVSQLYDLHLKKKRDYSEILWSIFVIQNKMISK